MHRGIRGYGVEGHNRARNVHGTAADQRRLSRIVGDGLAAARPRRDGESELAARNRSRVVRAGHAPAPNVDPSAIARAGAYRADVRTAISLGARGDHGVFPYSSASERWLDPHLLTGHYVTR
jgi:hypothetical protein